jgi:hypothetical protein
MHSLLFFIISLSLFKNNSALKPDKHLFPGRSSQLDALEMEGEKVSDPLTILPGYWINMDDPKKIRQNGRRFGMV